MKWFAATAALALLAIPSFGAEEGPPDVGRAYQKNIDKAWKQAAKGKNPADACAALKVKVKELLTGSHDEDVMAEALPALETCDVALPVHYFDSFLGTIASGGKKTCVDLMVEMKTQLTAMTLDFGLREDRPDPKRAIKDALSDRIEAICPEIGPVVLR